jgi:murein DD-endopeptidase MepM/ murein hydrolase activator NlpD
VKSRVGIAILLVTGALASTASAAVVGDPDVAALQVGLAARGLYAGTIDGLRGPLTNRAAQKLERQTNLPLRDALGAFGEPAFGSRSLSFGDSGWDVAALQFMLAWHGFPSATIDGAFGDHSVRALMKFERWAGLPADGIAGPAVIAALRKPVPTCPIQLRAPLSTPYTDVFGPRGDRFHTGVDYPAASGAPVAAAAPGRVIWAGDMGGGWGIVVTIAHSHGVQTMYAHLSQALVGVGQRVATGQTIAAVGATGHATGPHVHFEVHLRGAAVDPFTGLR